MLVGNSLGGYSALATAVAHPDLVRAVALLNAAGRFEDVKRTTEAAAEAALPGGPPGAPARAALREVRAHGLQACCINLLGTLKSDGYLSMIMLQSTAGYSLLSACGYPSCRPQGCKAAAAKQQWSREVQRSGGRQMGRRPRRAGSRSRKRRSRRC